MGSHLVLCVVWGLHGDGGGREEDDAVAVESDGVTDYHGGVCVSDQLDVFPSDSKE